MTFDDYLTGAKSTWNPELDQEQSILNCALGLAEFGEVLHLFVTEELEGDNALDELGDILFYVFILNYKLGLLNFSQESMPPLDRTGVLTLEDVVELAILGGEVQNLIKKSLFHGHGFERHVVAIDSMNSMLLCQIARVLDMLGLTLEDCMKFNNNKLVGNRYKDGFSADASINRS